MSGGLAEMFSRKLRVGGIGAAPARHTVTANEAECQALATVFGVPGIAALSGEFTLTAGAGHSRNIHAELALRAEVTQICSVTLEPFDSVITEHAQLRFAPAASLAENAESVELNQEILEGPDEIPFTGDAIDLGAVLAEQLALTLDPYPRKPGAELPARAGDAVDHPFASLAATRRFRR